MLRPILHPTDPGVVRRVLRRAIIVARQAREIPGRRERPVRVTTPEGQPLGKALGERDLFQNRACCCRQDKDEALEALKAHELDRKSTRLNSSHGSISYAVF